MVWLFALNSNLILLILAPVSATLAAAMALNSNLILLIRINGDTHKFAEISFKFQSDSINTLLPVSIP